MTSRAIHRTIRVIAHAACVLAACKGGRRESPSEGSSRPTGAAGADAAIAADANLDACRTAALGVPDLPPAARAQALLDACRPCGDWEPLLAWNTPPAEGGPTHAVIERAMLACNAFCEPNAKQRFLGTLDAARGQPTRTPWRFLGEICKAEVSAVPDARFMGAPYFALDRIARAIGAPAVLAPIELPLPALSITGVGLELPSVPGTSAAAGPLALTVDPVQILVGTLPIAKLSPAGLQVEAIYPGTAVEPKALTAALDVALSQPALAGRAVALLASYGLDAARVVDVIAAAGGHHLRLAVAAGGPRGWSVPGTLPIALTARAAPGGVKLVLGGSPGGADPASAAGAAKAADAAIAAARAAAPADLARGPVTITLERGVKVDALARVLAALSTLDVKVVALVKSPTKPSAAKP